MVSGTVKFVEVGIVSVAPGQNNEAMKNKFKKKRKKKRKENICHIQGIVKK